MIKRYRALPGNRWIWIGGLLLALSTSWSMSATKTARKPIDWAALKPSYNGATFVSDTETCRSCHEDSMHAFEATTHGQALKLSANNSGCESCHGPRAKHIENPDAELAFDKLTPAQQSAVCLQCHEGGQRFGWKAGAHRSNDVSCSSCHFVMEKKSLRALLARASASEICYECHGDVRAETAKTSHHPVREGRMDCASCHNVHSSTPGLLVKNTLNETCVTCHAEKRGPFIWEHAPVRESCANCHMPHGSNNRNLLANKDSFLCLSCHSYGGHVNLPRYNRVSNPYGSGCVNCHITTHGSNHPSGAKQTR
ncbi:MAG: DmsE family decaheme c-type cytochrome [Acidobacteria bacterium]|nr:DmsE family decaheme c-type cytochrome [Acidobacteriota bacterium]